MGDTAPDTLAWRRELLPGDRDAVDALVRSTGFFSREETAVAVELVDERLAQGEASGYLFLFALAGGVAAGYACYGPITATRCSYDLYWIAVRGDMRGRGIGGRLLAETEKLIRERGGCRLYAETSSSPRYAPTRRFYERHGFVREAVLEDFYAPGDGKAVYVKQLR
ncbi:MAG: N-acetyltransferase family protein [Spirochaetota bacterium]